MKTCQYCRSENEDSATKCASCGATAFIQHEPPVTPIPSITPEIPNVEVKPKEKLLPGGCFFHAFMWFFFWPILYTALAFREKKWYLWLLLPVIWFFGIAWFIALFQIIMES